MSRQPRNEPRTAVARRDHRAVEVAVALLVAAADLTADRRVHIELDDWMWEISRAIEPWPQQVVDLPEVPIGTHRRRMSEAKLDVLSSPMPEGIAKPEKGAAVCQGTE